MNNIFTIKSYKYQDNIAIIGGCFDVLHPGHIEYLMLSKKLGYKVLIALESDEFIVKNKKRYSIHNQDERAKILSSIKYIDYIIKLPFMSGIDDYLKLCQLIKPKAILYTNDDPKYYNKQSIADKIGCKMIKIDDVNINSSTSKIIENIQNSRIIELTYFGEIVKGLGIAGTLNCPTLNIRIDREVDLTEGVYLSNNILDGNEYFGISYFDKTRPDIIESHIFNYTEHDVNFTEVTLTKFLRVKMNFTDIDSLINQIKLDILLAKSMF